MKKTCSLDERLTMEEVARWEGVEIVDVIATSRHKKTILRYGTKTRFVISASTRSDNARGSQRHKQEIRRACRQLVENNELDAPEDLSYPIRSINESEGDRL